MAHSWVQMFPTEYDAFKAYAETVPRRLHAAGGHLQRAEITAFPTPSRSSTRCSSPMGYRPKGIRIDSGDIAYLTKKAAQDAG